MSECSVIPELLILLLSTPWLGIVYAAFPLVASPAEIKSRIRINLTIAVYEFSVTTVDIESIYQPTKYSCTEETSYQTDEAETVSSNDQTTALCEDISLIAHPAIGLSAV